LIKIGLKEIPALTVAGLRYSLAFVCLLPFALQKDRREDLHRLTAVDWLRLSVLGLLYYTLTQGAQFLGLAYLPAVTVSLLLNFTAVFVAVMGLIFLNERPTPTQWAGVTLFGVGILAYFYPAFVPAGQAFGLVITLGGVVANAASSILGRQVNRRGDLSPLTVTTVSMGIGAFLLLGAGLLIQGMPDFRTSPGGALSALGIIIWLAVVNTAIAFTLWNHTLRTLSAMESSIINSTMLIQIGLLAWLFLGETITWQKLVGMVLGGIGALLVQLRPRKQ